MSVIDILLIVPLGYGAWKGYSNGLVKEVAQLAGLVLAAFLAFHNMDSVAAWVTAKSGIEGTTALVAGFILIFGLVMFVVSGLVYGLNILLKITLLSIPNRIVGLFFGILKAGVSVSLMLILLSTLGMITDPMLNESRLAPYVKPLAPATYNVISIVVPGAAGYVADVENVLNKGADAIRP
jgi:membrane protein required for colicin V production